MSVLDRSALEASPLADLHAIASELGLDGFRRLRKADLIEAIIARGGGEVREAETETEIETELEPEAETSEGRPRRRARGGRGGRGRRPREAEAETAEAEAEPETPEADDAAEPRREERVAEGTVELLGNGSAFLRVNPDEPSDEDVYVSAAQVRRCELVTGDVVSGPVRRPRRSERYPSLIRVETINSAPAEEVAEGTRYDDLPATFPTEVLPLTSSDDTVKAIADLAPLGKGSRATIVGPARSGKSEALRRLAGALAGSGLEVTVVLAGVRPEEVAEWQTGPVPPVSAVTFAHSGDAQGQAVEQAVEQGRRIAARGGDAVVLVDGLDGMHPSAARRALAAARNIVDGGSLTVIAVSREPRGGETTVIALDAQLAGLRKFPALDVLQSGTLRPELLVGEKGAEAIAKARAKAAGS